MLGQNNISNENNSFSIANKGDHYLLFTIVDPSIVFCPFIIGCSCFCVVITGEYTRLASIPTIPMR